MSEFSAMYRGSVYDIDDPERRGRVRLLVPQILGESPSGWAEPSLPTGNTQQSINARVWVLFESGDINRPTFIARQEIGINDLDHQVGFDIQKALNDAAAAVEMAGEYDPALVQQAVNDAAEALGLIEDGLGSKTFFEAVEPTEETHGPLKDGFYWFDLSDNRRMHVYQEGAWVDASDARIGAFEADVVAAQEAADNAFTRAQEAFDDAQTANESIGGPGGLDERLAGLAGSLGDLDQDLHGPGGLDERLTGLSTDLNGVDGVADRLAALDGSLRGPGGLEERLTSLNDDLSGPGGLSDQLAGLNDDLSGPGGLNEQLTALDGNLSQAEDDIIAVGTRLNAGGDIAVAINDAAASPITDERLQNSPELTVWPFANNTIPDGTIRENTIADFSLVARKFNTTQHIIY